jgi:hypothetical protein
MNTLRDPVAVEQSVETIPNGPGAAAILAAGIGCAVVGILALAGDASAAIGKMLNFYNPVGTLSGVSTLAIIVWLVAWFFLNLQWRTKTVNLATVNVIAFIGLVICLLLTFPPCTDLVQGK